MGVVVSVMLSSVFIFSATANEKSWLSTTEFIVFLRREKMVVFEEGEIDCDDVGVPYLSFCKI